LITGRGWSNYGGDSGGTWDIGGTNDPSVSDALDCITNLTSETGEPVNTWNEVQDQVVNYYIDLYFATTPPYYPIPEPIVIPLLVAGAGGGFAAYLFKARRRK
jgi:hypothetical protein